MRKKKSNKYEYIKRYIKRFILTLEQLYSSLMNHNSRELGKIMMDFPQLVIFFEFWIEFFVMDLKDLVESVGG